MPKTAKPIWTEARYIRKAGLADKPLCYRVNEARRMNVNEQNQPFVLVQGQSESGLVLMARDKEIHEMNTKEGVMSLRE